MKETTNKLKKVIDRIVAEKNGILRLFALVKRTDGENKWDLLLSADWMQKDNSVEDIEYILETLRDEMGEDSSLFLQIVLLQPKNSFIQLLAKALIRDAISVGETATNVKLRSTFALACINLLAFDFTGFIFDVSAPVNLENKTAEQKAEEFTSE
jgi:hypothetical protein